MATALQPLFEAISNSIHSTQKKFDADVSTKGRVAVTVRTERSKANVEADVEDNGQGLDDTNWEAFTTTDTDNKIEIGGKGVGRLLWLDCFQSIHIRSVYQSGAEKIERSFRFVLSNTDQIQDLIIRGVEKSISSSFTVNFKGLRQNQYFEKFPGRENYIFQHITSHFLPVFIGARCPQITVMIGHEKKNFPDAINEIIFRRDPDLELQTESYGVLKMTMMECSKVASADLQGSNFVHFIGHDRTVHSQSIDGKLGLKVFGHGQDRVFHAILTGDYLDKHVNQQRTAFDFEDAVIERIIAEHCFSHIERFLEEPMAILRGEQRAKIEKITASYPSVAFGETDELQEKVPSGELKEDALYGHLSRERYRRDERQAEKIRSVLSRLKGRGADLASFKS